MKKSIKYLGVFLIMGLFFIGNVSAKNFECKLNGYTLTYNNKGELVSAKDSNGKKVEKRLESLSHPKKKSECPSKDEYKITYIDGDRTLYVAGLDEFSDTSSCGNIKTENKCKTNSNPKCVWNSEYKMCSVNGNAYLSCGDAKDIPPVVPELMSYAVNLLKIVTPIILIIVGIIELVKAVASTNEDSMKKAQSKLIKKVIAAVMVFFVITIVQFITLKVADSSDAGSIKTCLKCFLNGTDDCDSVYVKDGYGMCYFKDGSSKSCDSIVETE